MTQRLLGCQQRLIKNGITKEDALSTQRLPRKGDREAKSEERKKKSGVERSIQAPGLVVRDGV